MGLFNLKLGKLEVPLYDLGALAAGFYIGYNDGKGIDTRAAVEYLTKYGPTVFAVGATLVISKAMNTIGRWINKVRFIDFDTHNIEVISEDGTKRKYHELDEEERQEICSKEVERFKNLESRLENQRYLKPALTAGTRTAVETIIGYAAGRLYSQIN